jgi:hypothetical protein
VASASGNDPELAMAAKLALGRCAQKGGRSNDAQKRYRELVTADAPNEVLAGAWNGLGELALADGTSKRSGEDLRYALFAFLRGSCCTPGRGDPSDEYEPRAGGRRARFQGRGRARTGRRREARVPGPGAGAGASS